MENNLKEIKATIKTGEECISNDGVSTQFSLLDFWRWSVSNILSNATRGRLQSLLLLPRSVVILFPSVMNGMLMILFRKMELKLKSAAYIQSWNQKALSKISFSIKKARYWDAVSNMVRGEPSRPADVYVFCHLKHIDQDTIDPLKMEQWDFYVLPTNSLNNYTRSQHSITLNSLIKLTPAKKYAELSEAFSNAYVIHLQAIQ